VGKPRVAGVYTNQRLSLSAPREGPWKIGQGFKPDSGNLTVRDYRGASGNVRHGENVNPARDRKSGSGNPSPTAWRVRFLSQWAALFSRVHWPTEAVWQREERVDEAKPFKIPKREVCEACKSVKANQGAASFTPLTQCARSGHDVTDEHNPAPARSTFSGRLPTSPSIPKVSNAAAALPCHHA
jgi:hypothetical protein